MCKLFDEWSFQIEEYCKNNNLSFTKAKSMSKSWSKNDVILQYHDEEGSRKNLLSDIPMPIVLKIKKVGNELLFEQTEHTHKYLTL